MIEVYLADIWLYWAFFVLLFSASFFSCLLTRLQILAQLGFAAGARAVPQVSILLMTGSIGVGDIYVYIFAVFSPALRSMWEAPDVSIRPSQT